jgi:c-di-GMP-binding flagellar brake protein YcgR
MDNRRKHPRYHVAIAAEIETARGTLAGETRDVSEGGVAVILHEALAEQSTIDVTLLLTQDGIEDANEDPFECRASVMWAAPTEDGQAMMGLRFTQVKPDQLVRLQRFLEMLPPSAPAS